MSNNIKAMKHMTDMMTALGEVSVNAKSNIINNNEEVLRNIANKEANINKESIKEGLRGNNENIFCKHCGALIDSDSRFCKSCGKEQ